tara:strand:- start:102 stop:1091 length:990 start_codon:yes stop_codon:yes gene_type:complete
MEIPLKTLDVVSICNALIDLLIQAEESDIQSLDLNKGIMHLVDADRQKTVLSHFEGHETTTQLGGSCLNAIRTLAALDAKTAFAGMIGPDAFGKNIREKMSALGIQAALKEHKNEDTGTCAVLITPDGERTMNTNLGASCLFDESIVPEQEIKNSNIFHFCGYQWSSPEQIKAIETAIKIGRSSNTLISFDVADPFVVQNCREDFKKIIDSDTDVVFANEEESKMLYDSSPEEAAAKISASGAIAVIKLGAKGALIQRGEEVVKVSAEPTTVVDTTGAGDMFAAGFLYGLSKDKDLATCGKMAAIAAGDTISHIGASVGDAAIRKIKDL